MSNAKVGNSNTAYTGLVTHNFFHILYVHVHTTSNSMTITSFTVDYVAVLHIHYAVALK